MNKGTHFIGQPMYGQLIKLLSKEEILKFSREHNGERYVKHFDAYQHLVIMLYAVIKRFDSLREITDSIVSRGTQTCPSWHKDHAKAQYIVGRQRPQARSRV